MEDIYDIELTVKSEKYSDSTNGDPATYFAEKFALYARYKFDLLNTSYCSTVFISYLYEDKETVSTGVHEITEYKDIPQISKSDIDKAIEDDYEINRNKILGQHASDLKLNSILHCATPYKISDGRESVYTVIGDE